VRQRDEIAVADCLNHVVQIFNSNGDFTRAFGHQGSKNGEFKYPFGIAYDKGGNIFVADNSNHRIQNFSGEGRYMGMFGEKGRLDSQLSYPWGLSFDTNGNIVVADTANKVIEIFSPTRKLIKRIGGPSYFSFPVHCVQCDGNFIVSDSGDSIIRVSSEEGVYKYNFGKRGGGDGELIYPCFLSVTESRLWWPRCAIEELYTISRLI